MPETELLSRLCCSKPRPTIGTCRPSILGQLWFAAHQATLVAECHPPEAEFSLPLWRHFWKLYVHSQMNNWAAPEAICAPKNLYQQPHGHINFQACWNPSYCQSTIPSLLVIPAAFGAHQDASTDPPPLNDFFELVDWILKSERPPVVASQWLKNAALMIFLGWSMVNDGWNDG